MQKEIISILLFVFTLLLRLVQNFEYNIQVLKILLEGGDNLGYHNNYFHIFFKFNMIRKIFLSWLKEGKGQTTNKR